MVLSPFALERCSASLCTLKLLPTKANKRLLKRPLKQILNASVECTIELNSSTAFVTAGV